MKARAGISAGSPGATARAYDGLRRLRERLLHFDRRGVAGAATLGAAIVVLIALPLAGALNIWIDEAFTLHTTGAGALAAWARTVAFEDQPPLYFLLEAAWRTLNENSIAFARLPSIAFAAGAVALIVGAANRIAPRIPALVVALATAVNPIVIWAALEMRVYALVLFIGAGLTWMFFEGFLVERPARRARIAYVLFAVAGLYTQFYIGFVLVAHALAILAVRRPAGRAFAGSIVCVGIAFAPFIPIALADIAASDQFVERVSVIHALHEIANAVFAVVLPHDMEWSGVMKIGGFAVAGALAIALIVFGRPAPRRDPAAAVGVQWVIALLLFSLVFSATGAPLVPAKYLIAIAPSSLLAAMVFIASLTRLRRVAPLLAVVYAIFTATALAAQYHPPLTKPGDWQRVASTLSADGQTTPIAVFPAEIGEPLRWYVGTDTIPIPGPMPFTVDYVHRMTLTAESQVARVLDPVRARSNRLWVVTTGACRESSVNYYDYHCRYLESYLQHAYHIERSVEFRGAQARLYVVDSGLAARKQLR